MTLYYDIYIQEKSGRTTHYIFKDDNLPDTIKDIGIHEAEACADAALREASEALNLDFTELKQSGIEDLGPYYAACYAFIAERYGSRFEAELRYSDWSVKVVHLELGLTKDLEFYGSRDGHAHHVFLHNDAYDDAQARLFALEQE